MLYTCVDFVNLLFLEVDTVGDAGDAGETGELDLKPKKKKKVRFMNVLILSVLVCILVSLLFLFHDHLWIDFKCLYFLIYFHILE